MKPLRTLASVAAAAALSLQLGCDSPTGSAGHAPALVAVSAGERQAGVAGSELPQPLVAKVTDAGGAAVAGAAVSFTAAGGGQVNPASAVTDAQGLASTRWTLGNSTADSQTVAVQVKDAAGAVLASATAHATAQAGAPAAVVPAGNSTFTGTAGLALADSVAAKVTDPFGNPVPGAAVVWTVVSGGGTVSPASATTNAAGVAKAAWTLGARLDSAQVLDAAAGLTLHARFMAMANTGATAYTEKTAGDAQTDTAGKQLPQPLVVTVRLSDGRPVRGATVTWSPSAGTVSAPTSTTDSLGRASTRWTLGTTPGGQTLTAAAAGLPVTFSATALAAPLGGLAEVSGDGQYGGPGKVLRPLVVRAADIYGHPVAGVPVSWAVTAGGGSVSPTATTTDAAGLAQAQWTLGGGPYPQKVAASAPGVAPAVFTADTTSIALNLLAPEEGQAVGDGVFVQVQASSRVGAALTVIAAVDDSAAVLVKRRQEPYEGVLDLAGLPAGPRTLVVTAIGANGDTVRATRSIYHEPLPHVEMSPPAGTVALGGSVRVDVTCSGATPCDSIILSASDGSTSAELARGTGSLSATVSLAAFEGKQVRLRSLAYTPHGLSVSTYRRVFVESTPRWSPLASFGTVLLDVDPTRVLSVDSADAAGPAVKLRAAAGGAETVAYRIPAVDDDFERFQGGPIGFLHSHGAFFRAPTVVSGSERPAFFDWRDGSLAVAATMLTISEVRVAGDWAAFGGSGTPLWFRNLATGAQEDRGPHQYQWDVAPNGDLVYLGGSAGPVLRRVGPGAPTVISAPGDTGTVVATDGSLAAYGDCCSAGRRVAVVAPGGTVSYLAPGLKQPTIFSRYLAAANGWVAWVDDQVPAAVWSRGPDGTVRRVGLGEAIEVVTPAGDVVLRHAGRWYASRAPFVASPVDVGAAQGRIVYRPGVGVVALVGRSAFRVDY